MPQPSDTGGLFLISFLPRSLGISATLPDLWYRNNNKSDTLNENEPRKRKEKKREKIIKTKRQLN
jgi:hypothetical protein